MAKALAQGARVSPAEEQNIRRQIAAVHWYHTWEVVPGVVTEGQHRLDAPALLDSLEVAGDLTGKKVLDIGSWDGVMAFALEARGAKVTAIDVQHPDHTGFNVAKSIVRSNVRYVRGSVYDLVSLLGERFDLVVFFGVYYHLKHPLLAFEAIADSLVEGGKMLFEGELLLHYAETPSGGRSALDVKAIAASDVPFAACYTGDYKNASNWFVPNLACLVGWIEAAGMRVTRHFAHSDDRGEYPGQRVTGVAVRDVGIGRIEEVPIFERGTRMPDEHWRSLEAMRRRRGRTGLPDQTTRRRS